MNSTPYLEGQLLLAMPGLEDQRFDHSVIFLCNHDETGAMGLVINQPLPNMTLSSMLKQLKITLADGIEDATIKCGGPVEPGRGFVLHTADYSQDNTMVVSQKLAITATTDVMKAIADGSGPKNYLVALGYAGWGAGQLDDEIQDNSWMIAPAEPELLFHTENDSLWTRAMAMLGVDISMLSSESGHA